MSKCFFSHSIKDKEIVSKFIDMLVLSGLVVKSDCFCTSRPGDDIETGEKFVEYIGDQLKNGKYVFCFFSRNYLDSTFCMAELGASWILDKKIIPIIISDVDFDNTTPFCRDLQGISINDSEGLDGICDKLKKKHSSTKSWNKHKKDFLQNIQTLLLQQKEPNKIAYSEYEKQKEEIDSQKQKIQKLEKDLENKEKYVQKLEACKDKQEVDNIQISGSISDNFQKLCKDIEAQLKKLPSVAAHACFRYYKGEDLTFKEVNNETTELQDALDNEYLVNNENCFTPNFDSPKMRKLKEKLDELKKIMDCSEFNKIRERIEEDGEISAELTSKDFWTEYFGRKF